MFNPKWLLWLCFLCGSVRSSFGHPSYEEHWHGSGVCEDSQHTSYGEGSSDRNFVFSNEHGYHDESMEKGMGVSWDVDHEGSFVPNQMYHHDQTSSSISQLNHGFDFSNQDWDNFYQGDDHLTVSHGQVSHSMRDSSVIKRKGPKKTAARPGSKSHTTPSSAASAWSGSIFHFVAYSTYPFNPHEGHTSDVVKIILQTVKSPPFSHKRIGDQPLFRYLNRTYQNSQTVSKDLGFLINLCLKNLAFLKCLNHGLYAPRGTLDFQDDLVKTLKWLNKNLDRTGHLYNQAIDTHLNQHYQTKHEPNKHVIITRKSKRPSHKLITDFEAQQARLILGVLEAYYKETNPTKWAKLFDEDHTFLRFYLKLSYRGINGGTKQHVDTNEKIFRENQIPWLPWDQPWSDDTTREMMIFTRQSTMFDNAQIEDIIDNSVGFQECRD